MLNDMLQYLIIQLDNTSPSFCHYANGGRQQLMSVEMLRRAIFFAMTENLIVQFLVPDTALPAEYEELMQLVDHSIIAHKGVRSDADAEIIEGIPEEEQTEWDNEGTYIVRTSKEELAGHTAQLARMIIKSRHINVVLTDIETFSESDFRVYEKALSDISAIVAESLSAGRRLPQTNILTDRLMLSDMNNCNAGVRSVALMPDGKFYVCPAFYFDGDYDISLGDQSIGSLDAGLNISNPHLYGIKHAPICRVCDAWQCKRCVWLNCKLTNDVNTPSHQQCVISHIERRQGKLLGEKLKITPEHPMPDLAYDDPFEIANRWK